MNSKVVGLRAFLYVVLVLFAGVVLVAAGGQEEAEAEELGEPDVVLDLTAEGREFYIAGESEENPDLTVSQGDVVQVNLEITGGNHDWVVDEFDAATEIMGQGGTDTIVFVADQSGEFEYYCSVGSHRAQGMYGTLIVQ